MSSAHQSSVELQPCSSLGDYFFIRGLRNRNAHFMTNNANRISICQQLKFMRNKPNTTHLYIAKIDNKRVGYLLLDMATPDTTFITEAVDERWRRHGVGSAMINFAKTKAPHITAHIRATNTASVNLHQRCGFTQIPSNDENIVSFVFP